MAGVPCPLQVHTPEGFVVRRRKALVQLPNAAMKVVEPGMFFFKGTHVSTRTLFEEMFTRGTEQISNFMVRKL